MSTMRFRSHEQFTDCTSSADKANGIACIEFKFGKVAWLAIVLVWHDDVKNAYLWIQIVLCLLS